MMPNEFVLGHPGPDRRVHRGHRRFGTHQARLKATNLFGCLHGAHRDKKLGLAIGDRAPLRLQRQCVKMAAAIQPELHRPAAMGSQQIGDFGGEGRGRLAIPIGHRGPHQLRRTRLVDGVEHQRYVIALRVFEEDDRPLGRHEEVAGRVAQKIAEHVARAGGVALVVRIEQHHSTVSGCCHPVAQPGQSLPAQRCRIDEGGFGIGEPHAAGGIRGQRVPHGIIEVDIVHIAWIQLHDAHRSCPRSLMEQAQAAPEAHAPRLRQRKKEIAARRGAARRRWRQSACAIRGRRTPVHAMRRYRRGQPD